MPGGQILYRCQIEWPNQTNYKIDKSMVTLLKMIRFDFNKDFFKDTETFSLKE